MKLYVFVGPDKGYAISSTRIQITRKESNQALLLSGCYHHPLISPRQVLSRLLYKRKVYSSSRKNVFLNIDKVK